jgi:hypothetical protein
VVCVPYGYNEGHPVSALNCGIVENFSLLPNWIVAQERQSFALCCDDTH